MNIIKSVGSKKHTFDARAIYSHGHELMRAADALHQIADQQPNLDILVPALILDSFSVEVFLKCLICIETKAPPPHFHDLHKLFKRLSPPTRVRVTTFWDWYAHGMADRWNARDLMIGRSLPRDLESALRLGAQAFERMRYHYDKTKAYDYYLGAFPHMLNLMALELRPDWGGYPPGWKAPDDFSKLPDAAAVASDIRIRR